MSDGVRAAAERLRLHRRVVAEMRHPRESPYTYIEVETGAAGFVPAAELKDMATVVTAYLAEHPEFGRCGMCGSPNKADGCCSRNLCVNAD